MITCRSTSPVPALFQQWAPKVLDAAEVDDGHSVLDVACGTGVLAREASVRVGRTGSVAGVDTDPGMLAVAGQLEPAIEWRRGTAERLPFDDRRFDAVVSQFGLMFFEDPSQAVREMIRVARSGGRIAVAVWESLERSEAYPIEVEILERLAGARAADALRAPFAMGDRTSLNWLFETVGTESVEITTAKGTARFPSVRTMVEADLRGWLPVMGVVLDERVIESILDDAERALSDFVTGDGEVVFDAPAHIITGRVPR